MLLLSLYLIYIPLFVNVQATQYDLPEIYQDVLIKGDVIHKGVRSCSDRFDAIKDILNTLPVKFKSLDIGASQGYFSFRMAQEFGARCTMIEDGYTKSDFVWHTGKYLKYLCEQNSHLKDLTLLQCKVYAGELVHLSKLEEFDVVLAFSVIHHMKRQDNDSNAIYLNVIDAILSLAPLVIIENPVNTGEHTFFIQEALQKRGGKVIYRSLRQNLVYEIYLFDRRISFSQISPLQNIAKATFDLFNGTYTNVREIT